MEQHKEEIGTKKDLVIYRLKTAKSDLKSARILLAQVAVAEEFIEMAETYCLAKISDN